MNITEMIKDQSAIDTSEVLIGLASGLLADAARAEGEEAMRGLMTELGNLRRDLETVERALQSDIDHFDPFEYLDDDSFEEILNDIYGEIEVCGHTHEAGRLLRIIDPATFDQAKVDHASSMDVHDFRSFSEYHDLEEALEDVEENLRYVESAIEDLEEAIEEDKGDNHA